MSVRVLHIAHMQLRRYGATRVSWAKKLDLGLIKAGFEVHNFSDRDVAAFEAPFGYRPLGERKANARLLEMVDNVEPELVVAGHCDSIRNDTLAAIRSRPFVKRIIHCNNDPLFVPSNFERILHRAEVCDSVFVSTGRRCLVERFPALADRIWHMPNPVDAAIERADASANERYETDLIFASKSTDETERLNGIGRLREELDGKLRFRTPGSNGEPGIWGLDYDRALAATKMGLNINRQEGDYWYSSARMAQLGGNGLLVFTNAANGFQDLFPDETLVYFGDTDELCEQVLTFHADDAKRRAWASNTRRFFHDHLNTTLYARYIVETAMGMPHSQPYAWLEAV